LKQSGFSGLRAIYPETKVPACEEQR